MAWVRNKPKPVRRPAHDGQNPYEPAFLSTLNYFAGVPKPRDTDAEVADLIEHRRKQWLGNSAPIYNPALYDNGGDRSRSPQKQLEAPRQRKLIEYRAPGKEKLVAEERRDGKVVIESAPRRKKEKKPRLKERVIDEVSVDGSDYEVVEVELASQSSRSTASSRSSAPSEKSSKSSKSHHRTRDGDGSSKDKGGAIDYQRLVGTLLSNPDVQRMFTPPGPPGPPTPAYGSRTPSVKERMYGYGSEPLKARPRVASSYGRAEGMAGGYYSSRPQRRAQSSAWGSATSALEI